MRLSLLSMDLRWDRGNGRGNSSGTARDPPTKNFPELRKNSGNGLTGYWMNSALRMGTWHSPVGRLRSVDSRFGNLDRHIQARLFGTESPDYIHFHTDPDGAIKGFFSRADNLIGLIQGRPIP